MNAAYFYFFYFSFFYFCGTSAADSSGSSSLARECWALNVLCYNGCCCCAGVADGGGSVSERSNYVSREIVSEIHGPVEQPP